jgi:uncharacterized protein (TIGR03435 family)
LTACLRTMTIKYQVVLDISMAELVAIITAGSLDETDIQNAMLKAGLDALKKYGLQLEPRTVPVEIPVVDHLEKSPTENEPLTSRGTS